VDSIDLTVDSGEFFSLLGPSGCGKTTTLPLIAGFEQPTSGRILLDGTDMSGVPPHKRNVNTVFQSYALFPFLSVFDNVAFGLRYQKLARGEIATKVHGALDLVELGSYAKRRPAALSGGVPRRRHPGHAPPGARRPAPGARLQALVQNDGDHPEHLTQGTPVHVYLAPDALRVLRGSAQDTAAEPDELKVS